MKTIYIQSQSAEKYAIVMEGKEVDQLVVDRPEEQSLIGNIFHARVRKVEKSMQAAFVDFGEKKLGFLQKKEFPEAHANPALSIEKLVHEGQNIWVQVIKDAYGTKGAQLTANITIPNTSVIYLPFGDYVAISKKVEGEQRERLKRLGESWCEETEGIIFRTNSVQESEQVLFSELEKLRKQWKIILSKSEKKKIPFCAYEDYDIPFRLIRSFAPEQIHKIVIDHVEIANEMKEQYPGLAEKCVWSKDFQSDLPISFEQLIANLTSRIITMPNGIQLYFDQTEALHAIDVNTAKFKGKWDKRQTILQVNLEAVRTIANQIRLRNLSGMILIDFIDMKHSEDQKQVLARLKQELKRDSVRTEVYGYTKLGMVELTRKREAKNLLVLLGESEEEKQVKLSSKTYAYQLERKLLSFQTSNAEAILIDIDLNVFNQLKSILEYSYLKKRVRQEVYFNVQNFFEKPYEFRLVGSEELIKQSTSFQSGAIDKLF